MADTLLAEFDPEMDSTRRMPERVPDDRLDWRPHPKSFALGALAGHIAELPERAATTLATDELDLGSPAAQGYRPVRADTRAQILALFDANAAKGRSAIAAAPADRLEGVWTLRLGESIVLSMPRVAVPRLQRLNHVVHHRAQRGACLRLLDAPVPGMCGPTADER
jgi:hypothetical protein